MDARSSSQKDAFPGDEWQIGPGGFGTAGAVELARCLAEGGSTAMMIVISSRVAFSWGDIARVSSIASVRKSLMSLLYGIYRDEGKIDLDATLADIGIDDDPPLTPGERQATVRHLLMARSGIYHDAVYGTNVDRPPRGVYSPGTFWFYNNWDFNALATIFRTMTGEDPLDAFAWRIAAPIGLQDFSRADCRYLRGPASVHPVYKMRFSARDLARVGLLCLRGGQWGDMRIVSRDWIDESMAPHTDLSGGRGYGYMWWSARANAAGDSLSSAFDCVYASGFGGQYIIFLPALDAVIVHRSADVDHGISHARMGHVLRLAVQALQGSPHG